MRMIALLDGADNSEQARSTKGQKDSRRMHDRCGLAEPRARLYCIHRGQQSATRGRDGTDKSGAVTIIHTNRCMASSDASMQYASMVANAPSEGYGMRML